MGLAVGMMWTLYLIVLLIFWVILRRFIKRKLYKNIFLAFLVLLPFWDVLIQKTIKTYFEIFKMNPIVYSYPERDANGKVESLGLSDVTDIGNHNLVYNTETKRGYMRPYYDDIPQNVDRYVEVLVYQHNLRKRTQNIVKININKIPYTFENINIKKARYQIQTTKIEDSFFGFYSKKDFSLIDTKNKKLLAKSAALYFPNHRWYAWFRDDILFDGDRLGWKTPPPILFVKETSNLDEMIKEVLKIEMHTRDKYKGFKND